jgi:hypothetical protein
MMSMKNSTDAIWNHAIRYTGNLKELSAKLKGGEYWCWDSRTARKGVKYLKQ